MAGILKGLNATQRAAVTSSASVLQILAPPGSGKTKTLTSRVAYLIEQHGYEPQNVICCTFTIKAAREMRERLRNLVGPQLESNLVLGTFHSICRRYLVRYGHLIHLPSTFGIADSNDSLSIIKRLVKEHKLSIDARAARSRISASKARGRRIEEALKKKQRSVEDGEFLTIYSEYETSLAKSNLLDYDDLLLKCIDLLNAYPHCVRNVQALLIDEFQDTNVVQFDLMKLFAQANRRVTIVGDPDQSIYGFRAAESANLVRMRNAYPDANVINLEENYRSASAILKLAQDVIEQDISRPDKTLKATHCYGTLPVLRKLPNPHEEALWIVAELRRTMAATGNLLNYSDFAILLRSSALSLLIEKAFANEGIPYRMVGGLRFFDRVEVRLVVDYLRVVHSPDNDSALASIVNTPSRKLGKVFLEEIRRVAREKDVPLWSVVYDVAKGKLRLDKAPSKPAQQNLERFVTIVENARIKLNTTEPEDAPRVLIGHIVDKIGFKEFLKREYDEDHEDRWENVQELLIQATDIVRINALAQEDRLPEVDGVQQREVNNSAEVLGRFLANISLSTEKDSTGDEQHQQRVTISTTHSAKGLEWPVVFIPAVYEGSIPHSRAEDTDEERRVFYVAITRAQALLNLTFPVMQSRDMGESILTQFLPPEIHSRCSKIGPNFSDKTVADIASILRRPCPTQDDTNQSMKNMKDQDSISDDVWPDDGSRRRYEGDFMAKSSGFRIVESDQIFSNEGQGFNANWRSTNQFTLASNVTLDEPYSELKSGFRGTKSTWPTGTAGKMSFSTAATQYREDFIRQANGDDDKPLAALQTASSTSRKKAIDASQGSLSTWFSSGSFNNESSKPGPPQIITSREIRSLAPVTDRRRYDDYPSVLPMIQVKAEKTGTAGLFGDRRLPTYSTNLIPSFKKRKSDPLEEVPNKKNNYVFLSSSPNQEAVDGEPISLPDLALDENNVSLLGKPGVPGQSVTRQTLTRPASTFHATSVSQLQSARTAGDFSASAVRKTLGVRRMMNGWDARKNR